MRAYVEEQTAKLQRKLAKEVSRAVEDQGEEAIHDLRVAIRRLNRGLQVFSKLFPKRPRKEARSRLHELMDAAGEVRDRDIAAELLKNSGVKPESSVLQRLARERLAASEKLATMLRQWKEPDIEPRPSGSGG